MSDNLSVLAQKLRPFWLKDMSPGTYALISGGGGGMVVHAINGAYHTGTLDQSQAPWAALAGRVIGAGAGLTGGGDLTADRALNVGAGTLITVGTDDVGITPGANYQFVGTGSGTAAAWQNISGLAGNGLAASAGALSVGVANTGAAGLSAEADVVRLTSSSNPGAAAAVLASDASGYLTLVRLIASDRLRSPLLDTATGDMAITPAGDLTLNPTGGEIFIPGADTLRSTAWTPGLLGTGWGIQERAGQAGKSHLDMRSIYTDELIATTFTADQVRVRSGSDWLGESMAIAARDNSDAKVTVPNVGGGSVRIYVENAPEITGQIFDANEFVLIKTINRSTGSVIRETWGQVSSYQTETGNRQSYSWTTVNGSGNFTLEPGTALIGFGVNAGSFIFRTVVEAGRGPFERFATWSTNPYTPANRISRVESGDLRNAIGDATTRYGIAAGNNLALTPSTGFAGFAVDSVYGARLYSTQIELYNAGTKTVNISNTGTDIWVGPSSADKRLAWDGTTLTLRGNLKVQQDANNYVEINQALNKLRGVGAGTEQWYATASDGRLYAGSGSVLIDAAGLSLIRQGSTTPAINWRVGATSYGGVSYYTSGDGYETVRFMVSADPSRILLATYNPGDVNNPPASITLQQNAYTPLVAIKGATTITGTLDVSGAINGYPMSAAGNRWGAIAYIDGAAFMDVGGYVDFHAADGDAAGVKNLRLDGGMSYTAGLGITNSYGYVAVGPNNASYCHFQTDRPAYYFNKSIVVDGTLSTYNQDLELRRNGTQRLIGYSWGTYVTAHLTLEDVLGIVNVQASKPANPSTGCKIYLRDAGAGVHLYVLYPSGTETRLD